MRCLAILYLVLLLFLGPGCASRTPETPGGSGADHQFVVEARLQAYDRQEERFRVLFDELWERWGEDPQLIEAVVLVSVAEEFYLMAEYETAMEILQQAILLLEEKQRIEETPL